MSGRTEADVAGAVVAEMQRYGWTVYQEVQTGPGGARADIVGVDEGGRAMVVECKTSLSLALFDQLLAWQGWSHWIVGAAPCGYRRSTLAAQRLAASEGFGLWLVGDAGWIEEKVSPRLYRLKDKARILQWLDPDQTTGEWALAGSPSAGSRWLTPYTRTVAALECVVGANPGITLKEAIGLLSSHHYASDSVARSAIAGWIRKGQMTTLRAEGGPGRPLRLFLRGKEEQ